MGLTVYMHTHIHIYYPSQTVFDWYRGIYGYVFFFWYTAVPPDHG